jgi:hypothetical protein
MTLNLPALEVWDFFGAWVLGFGAFDVPEPTLERSPPMKVKQVLMQETAQNVGTAPAIFALPKQPC